MITVIISIIIIIIAIIIIIIIAIIIMIKIRFVTVSPHNSKLSKSKSVNEGEKIYIESIDFLNFLFGS